MTDQFKIAKCNTLVASLTNPRTIFDEDWIDELGESILDHGVVQPILVRPLPAHRLADTAHLKPRPEHEIVVGECRWRGSNKVNVEDIPVLIRELSDQQVLVIQIIENLKRKDLSELETAEGYQKLMLLNNLSADEVVKEIGKSRSYLYGCLKLLDLHPTSKEALRRKDITASAALLIARIGDIALQNKAVAFAVKPDDDGHKPSIRAFQTWLRDNVMLDLSKATFPIESISLTVAGSCRDCKTRTGYDPDLFADVKSDMCTHPPCYHLKAQAHKDALAAKVAAIRKTSNRNVDEQHELGLASTLAQDARAESRAITDAAQLKNNITTIRNGKDLKIEHRSRHAIFDKLKDYIKATKDGECCDLLGLDVLREWLVGVVDFHGEEEIGAILDMGLPDGEHNTLALQKQAVMRVQAASRADIYRYIALAILVEDRVTIVSRSDASTLLFNAFAAYHGIDIDAVRHETVEDIEDEMQTKIAAINKQIKATKAKAAPAKPTSTPPPAGAAIDTGEANAKKPKPAASPAGASRKAKTTAQEAISGIAAAMQGMEAAPLGAALGGAEAATGVNASLTVMGKHSKVKVLDGKHKDKTGFIAHEVGSDMWNVTLHSGVNLSFSKHLPTKSLQVIA